MSVKEAKQFLTKQDSAMIVYAVYTRGNKLIDIALSEADAKDVVSGESRGAYFLAWTCG